MPRPDMAELDASMLDVSVGDSCGGGEERVEVRSAQSSDGALGTELSKETKKNRAKM